MRPALVAAEILLAERQIRECVVCDRPCHALADRRCELLARESTALWREVEEVLQ